MSHAVNKRYQESKLYAVASLEKEIARYEAQERDLALQRAMYEMTFLPHQEKLIQAFKSHKYHVILDTSGNKLGKTWGLVYICGSDSLGYFPHDGTPIRKSPYDIAFLVRDFDSHAMAIYREGFCQMLPESCVNVVARANTKSRAPRILQLTDPITGVVGKNIHFFSHDQDASRLERGSFHSFYVDEPCPQRHWEGLLRGLQTTNGTCVMTMTLMEGSQWIWDEIHVQAGNNGGPNEDYYAIVAEHDENFASQGGFLEDQAIERYRKTINEEYWDARVHGRALHLSGQVYKAFRKDVHIIDQDLVDNDTLARCPKILVIDPHDRLPWAMGWFYITPCDDLVLYDEWPDRPFEKLRHSRNSYDDYARIIEAKGPVTWNLMDPNFGRRPSLSTGFTVAQEITMRTNRGFIVDTDDTLDVGHMAVQKRLEWDESRPLSAGNQPHLYIKRKCRNSWRSLLNYAWDEWRGRAAEGKTPKNKPQERFKHFADIIRYACMNPAVRYIDLAEIGPRRYEGVSNIKRRTGYGQRQRVPLAI